MKKEQSVDELRALADKLQERKKNLEAEAVDLIARIVNLGYLKEERAQTRAARRDPPRIRAGAGGKPQLDARHHGGVARGSVPDKPFEDKRKAMAMVGMMGGVGFGFALIALWGMVRPTIRSEKDLGALGACRIGGLVRADAPVHSPPEHAAHSDVAAGVRTRARHRGHRRGASRG